jgi:hypothetical protein
MLHNEGLACQQAKDKGRQRRAGDVNDIGFSNELPELDEAWLANRAEWIYAVVVIPRWSSRHQRNFELQRPVRIAESGKAACERKNNGLDTANTRREEVRINQELHS